MNKVKNLIIFTAGAAIGSLVTWKLVKNKYEQLAQEEIDSVKETFFRGEGGPNITAKKCAEFGKHVADGFEDSIKEKANQAKEKPDIAEYAAKLQSEGYTNYSDISRKNKKTERKELPEDKPYVISPEEFGEFEDYAQIELTYYANQILADDDDEIIEDVDDIVGVDSLSHFGEYEDDSVFVRNDRLKCDYQILLDHRKYSDIVQNRPYPMEE